MLIESKAVQRNWHTCIHLKWVMLILGQLEEGLLHLGDDSAGASVCYNAFWEKINRGHHPFFVRFAFLPQRPCSLLQLAQPRLAAAWRKDVLWAMSFYK